MSEQNSQSQMKLDAFAEAVQNQVEDQCFAITGELEDYRTRELAKYKEDVRSSFQHMADREIKALEQEAVSEMGEQKQELKKKLYTKREEYSEQIFAEAEKRLLDFANSDEYHGFMQKKAENMAEQFKHSGSLLLVREQDISTAQELAKLFDNCKAQATEEIHIGGMILENKNEGYRIDESLDIILQRQHEWFHTQSGLTISL